MLVYTARPAAAAPSAVGVDAERIAKLEAQVAELREQVALLEQQFADFRSQFS